MAREPEARSLAASQAAAGFSLLEMLASVSIITLLMAAVFSFMFQAQKRFQGNVVTSESNQSARAALEIMTQEIGQAGFNPNFTAHRKVTSSIDASAAPGCLTLYNASGTADGSGINPGDWLSVDAGVNNELVRVVGTNTGYLSATVPNNVTCASAGQVRAVFQANHSCSSSAPCPVMSYKFPYPTGIQAPPTTTPVPSPYDQQLAFYGDVNNNPNNIQIAYVVYSLNPLSPLTTVTVSGAACSGSYTLYNLYRSITPVTFVSGTVDNNPASVLVQNVLYDTTNQRGPTCQPIFGYPVEFMIGVAPTPQITVVGTLLVTISVAVNPRSLESGRIEWYTMATQIRPLNLAATVAVNQAGGYRFLPPKPLDVPLTIPSGYYQ